MEPSALPASREPGVLYLKLDDVVADPVLHHFAGCLRALRPSIVWCGEHYGYGTTMAALVSIVANAAIEHDVAPLIADALRQNAAMLDERAPDSIPVVRA